MLRQASPASPTGLCPPRTPEATSFPPSRWVAASPRPSHPPPVIISLFQRPSLREPSTTTRLLSRATPTVVSRSCRIHHSLLQATRPGAAALHLRPTAQPPWTRMPRSRHPNNSHRRPPVPRRRPRPRGTRSLLISSRLAGGICDEDRRRSRSRRRDQTLQVLGTRGSVGATRHPPQSDPVQSLGSSLSPEPDDNPSSVRCCQLLHHASPLRRRRLRQTDA